MNWNDIIGHSDIVAALKSMLTAGIMPHALLFSGPAGIGKSLTARILAAGILCAGSEGIRPCGACPSCMACRRAGHPDLTVVQPEGTAIKIGQIRALKHFAALSPALSQGRVCVIEDAELMTVQAANSLLKLLEEPPPHFYFILAASALESLLPTIISRCRILKFSALPAGLLTDELVKRGFGQADAAVASRLSGGRLGTALALLEPDGLARRDQAFQLVSSLSKSSKLELWEWIAGWEGMGQRDMLDLLNYVIYILRDVLLLSLGNGRQLIYNVDLTDRLAALNGEWDEDGLLAAIGVVRETIRAITGNANSRLAMEALFIKLKRLEKGEQAC
ncbi:MAG TPA: DNA polymerase III subunit delta' [Methylomusa anaerophila]|uniref:DNA polymerase III subunit tau n=1 Tax=Methylomusa anaerophila TaxID=1930071 RepID=A0A348AGY2_9FIRM|nr:DNA polymerase III subunit delta' [Methylomusa anaerophila]BBB90330.1 DNA polymerase III subunit tau [Methylomusa anaerophila]HML89324.1 DNA polymerase III subunit delta' [Methylomusa anaerophila]